MGITWYILGAVTQPGVQFNLTLTVQRGGNWDSVQLSWSEYPLEDFASYTVYRSTVSGVTGDLVATIENREETSATVSGLTPGRAYYFTVRVNRTGGGSIGSNQASFTAGGEGEQVEYDEGTYQLDLRIPSEVAGEEGIAVRVIYPKTRGTCRYQEGSPVVVFVPGGNAGGSLGTEVASDRLLTGFGVTCVYFNFPGGGTSPYRSGGTYDDRGPFCQLALKDIILFALGVKEDNRGRTITDLIPYADTGNVGVVGWSNGGNIVGVVFDVFGQELSGVKYYVGYENPSGDEYVLLDLGRKRQRNRAYVQGESFLDPVEGSVSELDPTGLTYDPVARRLFFDFDGDNYLDLDDYECGYWDFRNFRYFSTEVTRYALEKGIELGLGIALGSRLVQFWENRDMSRHYAGVATKLTSLLGAMIFSSEEDHAQNVMDYPHTVINYQGWSRLPFVRLNPDLSYVEHVLEKIGFDASGITFTDTCANMSVTMSSVSDLVEPELHWVLGDQAYVTACVLEMADRVHSANWSLNLDNVLGSEP